MGSNNPIQFVTEERVRVSILKHRADLQKVVEECGVSLDLVQRIYKRYLSQRKRDIAYDTATKISEHILFSYEEQMVRIRELLDELSIPQDARSRCCNDKITVNYWQNEPNYNCKMCGKQVPTPSLPTKEYAEIRRLLGEMRKLQDSLAVFADRMGLTFKKEDGDVPTNQTNVYVQSNKEHNVSEEDRKFLEEAGRLDAPARERLIKRLEAEVLDVEFEEEDGSQENS